MPDRAPLVSVVMSVYNDGPFVKEAVASILGQSFGDFEFVIVDDGSIDDSVQQIKEFCDPRIRLLRQGNRGLAEALNRGIKASRGQYIARQDGDDISEPWRLEKQVRHLEANSEIGLMGSQVSIIDESGKILVTMDFPGDDHSLQRLLLSDGKAIPLYHGAVMFRKSAAIKAGLYRPEFKQAQDLDFFLRLAEGTQLANFPEVAYRWRLRKASVNNTKWENQRDYARMARWCAKCRRRGEPEPEISLVEILRPLLRNGLSRLRKASAENEYDFSLAKLMLNAGQKKEARVYLMGVIIKQPNNFYAWLLLGLSAFPQELTNRLWDKLRSVYWKAIWKK